MRGLVSREGLLFGEPWMIHVDFAEEHGIAGLMASLEYSLEYTRPGKLLHNELERSTML